MILEEFLSRVAESVQCKRILPYTEVERSWAENDTLQCTGQLMDVGPTGSGFSAVSTLSR